MPNPAPSSKSHSHEVLSGERFAFGDNWANFLSVLDEARIAEAEESLRKMLDVEDLREKSFLDIGSGSGLFSLAARRLGARVVSFDYDPQSVTCTSVLKNRYFENDASWIVLEGSALDPDFLMQLGTFDIVYSWGVLHHTGAMWAALKNVSGNVAENGKLFLALYNDQGTASRRWLVIKKTYNSLPDLLKLLFAVAVYTPLEIKSFLGYLLQGRPQRYFSNILHYQRSRGMSWWHDQIDWIGGYPFEVSKPEEIFDFFKALGFQLNRITTCAGGLGCNQFVFQRTSS